MSEFDQSWLAAVDPTGVVAPQPVRVLRNLAGQQTTAPQEDMGFGFGSLEARRKPLQNVPPFLNKLYNMIWDEASNDLIRWSPDGLSFIITSQERFALEVLPRFFKHNKFSSFNRQLNNHGFRKVTHVTTGSYATDMQGENTEFQADLFQRDRPDLMVKMTRKNDRHAKKGTEENHHSQYNHGPHQSTSIASGHDGSENVESLDMSQVAKELHTIKQNQATLTSDLHSLQRDNRLLYQELMLSRESFRNQQDTVDKILKFLASVFAKETDEKKQVYLPRKRRLLEFPGSGPAAEGDDKDAQSPDGVSTSRRSPTQQSMSIQELSELLPEQFKQSDAVSNGASKLGNNIESFARALGIDTSGLQDMNIDDILGTFQKNLPSVPAPRLSYLTEGSTGLNPQTSEPAMKAEIPSYRQGNQPAIQPATITGGLEFPPTTLISNVPQIDTNPSTISPAPNPTAIHTSSSAPNMDMAIDVSPPDNAFLSAPTGISGTSPVSPRPVQLPDDGGGTEMVPTSIARPIQLGPGIDETFLNDWLRSN